MVISSIVAASFECIEQMQHGSYSCNLPCLRVAANFECIEQMQQFH